MFIKNGSFQKFSHIISYVPPVITKQPIGGNVKVGNEYTFFIKVIGSRPITYQWYINNFPLSNQKTDTLYLSNCQISDQANYYCRIGNNQYSYNSDIVFLAVKTPPVIFSEPQNITTSLNLSALFTVAVSGSEPFYYQWYKDGLTITSTGSSHYIPTINPPDIGNYYVIISNDVETITSNTVLLSVV